MAKVDRKILGVALKVLRTRAGLSVLDVAKELGITKQSVSAWERGGSKPSKRHLVAFLVLVRSTDEVLAKEVGLAVQASERMAS